MAIFSNVYKAGRCFNGFHNDRGTIIHIVPGKDNGGFWGTKALCGTEPGGRGYGWAATDKEPTCPKCIAKKAKAPLDLGPCGAVGTGPFPPCEMVHTININDEQAEQQAKDFWDMFKDGAVKVKKWVENEKGEKHYY